jgi:hypothetical protein
MNSVEVGRMGFEVQRMPGRRSGKEIRLTPAIDRPIVQRIAA